MSLSLSGNCLSCGSPCGLEALSPYLAGVVAERVDHRPGLVCLSVRSRSEQGACPRCQVVSCRVHSRYMRRLADAAVGGQRVVIRVAVRRFFCDAAGCPARTFAEQVEGLKILMALLDILDCTMDDLIEPVAAASPARRARKTAAVGAGESSGIGARRPKRARITGPPQ